MKVLHLVSADLWGGAEAQVNTLCIASRRLGLVVSAVLLNRKSELSRRLRSHGIDVLELDESSSGSLTLLRSILAHARLVKPDVIHTHRFKENILGGLVARLCGSASIRTLHGAPEPEIMRATLRRRTIDFIDAAAARHLQSHVVAVSGELATKVAARYPGANIQMIPNGVDVAALRAQSLRTVVPAEGLRLGFLGRLVPVKRVDLLLAAFAELRTTMARPVELVIVGDGPDRANLEKISARLGLGDSVRFAGFQAESAAWMASMDAVVLTSDHEGLPMVVLEALALGVPVVARAVGGIPEILQPVNPRWLVQGDSPTAIAQALAEALAANGDARGRTGRPSLLDERYSAGSMARGYLSIYENAAR
jgi:glycosyltransferase involved in cell wall biosynthesis